MSSCRRSQPTDLKGGSALRYGRSLLSRDGEQARVQVAASPHLDLLEDFAGRVEGLDGGAVRGQLVGRRARPRVVRQEQEDAAIDGDLRARSASARFAVCSRRLGGRTRGGCRRSPDDLDPSPHSAIAGRAPEVAGAGEAARDRATEMSALHVARFGVNAHVFCDSLNAGSSRSGTARDRAHVRRCRPTGTISSGREGNSS